MISTLVIGGGIGGLSLARELAIRDLPVTVLEKARSSTRSAPASS